MIVHGTIGMDHLKLFRKRLVYSNFFRIHFLNFTLWSSRRKYAQFCASTSLFCEFEEHHFPFLTLVTINNDYFPKNINLSTFFNGHNLSVNWISGYIFTQKFGFKENHFGTCPEECKADAESLTALLRHTAISAKKANDISLNASLKFFRPQKAKSILSTLWQGDGLFRLFLSAMHTVESIRLLCVALRPRF